MFNSDFCLNLTNKQYKNPNNRGLYALKSKAIEVDFNIKMIKTYLKDGYIDQNNLLEILYSYPAYYDEDLESIVYKITDNLKEFKEKEEYVGNAVDLGLTNAVSIAVDHKLANTLLEDKTKVKPFVYVKTDDDRLFTDEELIEGKDIVELIEEKEEVEEQKEENASNQS